MSATNGPLRNRVEGKNCMGTRTSLFAVGVAVFAGASAGVGSAQEPASVLLAPCAESCGIELVVEGEYGEDSGSGMIETAAAFGWMDASGRVYVAGISVSQIWVFAPDGSFLRRIGRRGEGPGEFLLIQGAIGVDDGVFSVLDPGRGVIVTYDWTGALLSETRLRGWVPTGAQTLHFEGSLAIHSADIRTADRVGYPLHIFNLETGEIEVSFGSRTGEYHLDRGLEAHVFARGPGRAVWMARLSKYEIELWEPNRALRSMHRNVEWFPELSLEERRGRGHGWDAEPTSGLIAMVADDSLLWVLIDTPDERWRQAAATHDIDLFVDTRIEVIDWRQGRVIASDRFDERLYTWIQPGLAGRLTVKPDGSVRYQTLRARISRE